MYGSNKTRPRLTGHEFPRFGVPRRLPDLAPCYLLWGYYKSLVYSNRQKTLDELKSSIRGAIAKINAAEMLDKVDQIFRF